MVGLLGSGAGRGGGPALAAAYHASLEASAAAHFPQGNHVINCMCHSSENLYSMQRSNLARVSDDFYPLNAASHTAHIVNCAYNSLLMGELVVPDWGGCAAAQRGPVRVGGGGSRVLLGRLGPCQITSECAACRLPPAPAPVPADMFHSEHAKALLHATARAVSGERVRVPPPLNIVPRIACGVGWARLNHVQQTAPPPLQSHAGAAPLLPLFPTLWGGAGGPVYVSDRPGRHDFQLLRRLVLPDGGVLRCLLPARPTADCLFADVGRDGGSVLKLWNANPYTALVACFNLQGASWRWVAGVAVAGPTCSCSTPPHSAFPLHLCDVDPPLLLLLPLLLLPQSCTAPLPHPRRQPRLPQRQGVGRGCARCRLWAAGGSGGGRGQRAVRCLCRQHPGEARDELGGRWRLRGLKQGGRGACLMAAHSPHPCLADPTLLHCSTSPPLSTAAATGRSWCCCQLAPSSMWPCPAVAAAMWSP